MNIVLVVVVAGDVILVRVMNQFNDDDDDDDGNRRDFLRTFILLFIFNICSLLSLIGRLSVKCTVSTATFDFIFFSLSHWVCAQTFRITMRTEYRSEFIKIYCCLATITNSNKTKRRDFDTHMFADTDQNPIKPQNSFFISTICYVCIITNFFSRASFTHMT